MLDLRPERVNREMVELEEPDEQDAEFLREIVERHLAETGSTVAKALLADWDAALKRFSKIMPLDYKRVLEARGPPPRRKGATSTRRSWPPPTGEGASHIGRPEGLPRPTPRGSPAPPPGRPMRLMRLARGLRGVPAPGAHASRPACMDYGIPFCHNGCPLGDLIPEWNNLVWRRLAGGVERLHATNNFPEFTGRLCTRRARRPAC